MKHADLVAVVTNLIEAENKNDGPAADRLLAPDFVAITRSHGAEHNRKELLNKIVNPGLTFVRRIEGEPWVEHGADLAVVRSVVVILDGSPPAEVRFRNTHVLKRYGDEWKCLAWQVTKLAWPPEQAI